jgi:hypothetical protein
MADAFPADQSRSKPNLTNDHFFIKLFRLNQPNRHVRQNIKGMKSNNRLTSSVVRKFTAAANNSNQVINSVPKM